MLKRLTVQNIALIDQMTLSFEEGLHVLTGETGAGKSIIVDAVKLLLGGKTEKELLRTGASFMRVEGEFDLSDCPRAQIALKEEQIEAEENQLILFREVSESGRSVCRANGVVLPLSQYRELASVLVELHGQHAFQALTQEKNHLSFLDAYGNEAHAHLVRQMKETHQKWKDDQKEVKRLSDALRTAEERREILERTQTELSKARIREGEMEELQKERDRFTHVGKIDESLRVAYGQLYEGSGAALEHLRSAMLALNKIADLSEAFAALSSKVSDLYYETEDAGLTCETLLQENDADPARQEEVISRLDMLRRLSRRYGATEEEMLRRLRDTEKELAEMENADSLLFDAQKKEKESRAQMEKCAAMLRESREETARRFSKAVEKELKDLNMASARLKVEFQPKDPDETGDRAVRFLIASNQGEEYKPLSSTASGGELSRLMLSFKTAMAEKEPVPTLIFDEVDSGISGKTAQAVADKMRAIAKTHQVLCVTHLQQIASAAEVHYKVEKSFDGERTTTAAVLLSPDARVEEIARLLGGEEESARMHAREMLRFRNE